MLDLVQLPRYHYNFRGLTTTNRNQALMWAGPDTHEIKFYFMDHAWDSVDWSEEPTESIEAMAHRRCREIREKYDWLCLWLSAGYDSQTVLKYFIDAGVKIDEIGLRNKYDLFGDPEAEFVKQSAEDYRVHHNPAVKFTEIRIGLDYHEDFYKKHKQDWIMQPGGILRFIKSSHNYLFANDYNVLKLQENHALKRADIYGKEKPKLDLRDGKWYMWMYDMIMLDSIGERTVVDFFLPESDPYFFVKQCHMAIKYFESLPNITHTVLHEIQSNKYNYQAWNLALGRVLPKCPQSRTEWIKHQVMSSPTSPDGKRMQGQLEKEKNTVLDYWQEGLEILSQRIGPDKDIFNIGIFSRQWEIRNFNNSTKNSLV